MSPAPSPQRVLSPVTSFLHDIGLHGRSTHPAFEIEGNPLPDPIGDIWQAEEAASAFEEGILRSISLDSNRTEGDSSADANNDGDGEQKDEKDEGDESDEDDDEDFNRLGVVFRNESPAPLILCWLSESGSPHHFYRLGPLSDTTTSLNATSFEKLKTDHLENTGPGHAFCLGYVPGEEALTEVRKSRTLIRNKTEQNGTDGVDESKNDGVEDRKDANIVIAGYRPFKSKPALSSLSSASSSPSLLSRHVQLVTIKHVSTQRRRRRRIPWVGEKRVCSPLGPWCLGRRKSTGDDDSDCDSDDDNDLVLDPKGWRVTARWVRLESEAYDTTNKVYDESTLGGWPCKLEPNWNNGDKTSAEKLERDIREAALLLPPHARSYLQEHCKIWVNRSLSWGPKSCPVRGRGCCYHPSKEWLLRNGLSGMKHRCVEVNNGPCYKEDCDLWGIGGVMLHELSHAYHHGMLPGGYANKEIIQCYEMAMKEGLYDSVEYHCGISRFSGRHERSKKRAYACTNAMEYFAELSAAFLGGLDESKEYNKWYPFNRKQIQEHDPRAYELLSRLWKVDVNFATAKTS